MPHNLQSNSTLASNLCTKKNFLLSIAFCELAAILAAIHFGLMPGSNRCAITITLHGEWYQRHVGIGALTIPAEVDAP